MFIVIEGIEGSGKSTLVAGLAARLQGEGCDCVVTREPGGTALGNAVREIFLDRASSIDPLSEAFLVNAARAQHVEEVIRPALAAGRIVLCDRFTDSTLAYQGYGRGFDLGLLRRLCQIATAGLEPGLVFVLDVPVGVARARMSARGELNDRIEAEGDAFHERVRAGFLALAKGSAHHRVLDGVLPQERLLNDAVEAVRPRLGVRVP